MPLAFDPLSDLVEPLESIKQPQAVSRVLDLIARAERVFGASNSQGYNVTLRIDLRFAKAADSNASHAQIVHSDPSAPKLKLSEDQLRDRYPWDYQELVGRLKKRYTDFKVDRRFHAIKKKLQRDPALCWSRHLDLRTKKGNPKCYYNSNILGHFDKHYSTEHGESDSEKRNPLPKICVTKLGSASG